MLLSYCRYRGRSTRTSVVEDASEKGAAMVVVREGGGGGGLGAIHASQLEEEKWMV